jgi:hypothetical protein
MTDHRKQGHEPVATDREPGQDKDQANNAQDGSRSAPTPPKDHKPQMRNDLAGEFDYGIEGGQTQDHGPDRTDGTPPAKR